MHAWKTLRFLLPRFRRRGLILLIATLALIFVVTTIILPVKTNRKIGTSISNYERSETQKVVVSSHPSKLETTTGVTSNVKQEHGNLNLHIWSICGFSVNSLRYWPHFPRFPERRYFLAAFTTEVQETNIGQRVFGFLNPQLSGKYHFAITSDDASELWLSANEDPMKVRMIAEVHDNNSDAWTIPGDFKKYPTQISRELNLKSGQKYFIESLHKNGAGVGHVSVLWKPPGAEQFSIITGQYLSPFCADDNSCIGKEDRDHLSIPSHFKQTPPEPVSEETFQYYYNTSAFDEQHLEGVLPVFPYNPSYLVKDVKTYQGIWLAFAHHSSVYPEDTLQIKAGTYIMSSVREFRPNEVLPKVNAEQIVNHFMSVFEEQHKKRFSLKKVIGVEGKEDKQKGTRYFLELKLHDTQENKHLRLAEYMFRDSAGHLWFTKGLSWKRNATIYFIVPVKNQVKWVLFLVKEMSKLYLRTRDENFRLLIVDFESTDGDINKILKDSPLAQKYTLLKKSGAFHKTLAIQDAVKTVSDPDSIVFLFDLHITVPITLLDSIRKHTIQSKTIFLPIVARLDCGSTPVNPKGRWEEIGSGLVAVYKSDWERFHGMNVEKFKTKWGGEDWDLLDRMLRVGLESERLKIPGFYHFFHTKDKMWEKTQPRA